MMGRNYSLLEEKFNGLVIEWNSRINLVSRKKTDVYDLIEDSKIFIDYIDFSANPKIMDLGTGGGFPGIVIKINNPGANMILVDSIMKKITAVCEIISNLELKKISAVCARAEDLNKNNVFKHTFDYVVSRSVGELKDLIKWSRGLLKTGGKLITLKGGNLDEELKHAMKIKYVKNIDVYDRGDRKVFVVSLKNE